MIIPRDTHRDSLEAMMTIRPILITMIISQWEPLPACDTRFEPGRVQRGSGGRNGDDVG
jgi:hypothetical protein